VTGELDRYHLYHATRADLWRELGRPDEARAADRRALELTAIPAEQAVLQERIAGTHRLYRAADPPVSVPPRVQLSQNR
jgi:predicted RNA polymerase sigma factor